MIAGIESPLDRLSQPRKKPKRPQEKSRKDQPPGIPIDAIKAASATPEEPKQPEHPCPCCGWPHDHHRDLLARTTAKCFEKPSAPPHTGSTSNQDRHLMMPAPSIRHRIDHLHSGSLSPGSAPACVVAPHRPAAPPQIRSRNRARVQSRFRNFLT
jgi:hypothetical protein